MKIWTAVIMIVAIAMIIAIPTLAGAVVGMLISFMFAIDVTPHSAHWSARWILCQPSIPTECGTEWKERAVVKPAEDSLPGRL